MMSARKDARNVLFLNLTSQLIFILFSFPPGLYRATSQKFMLLQTLVISVFDDFDGFNCFVVFKFWMCFTVHFVGFHVVKNLLEVLLAVFDAVVALIGKPLDASA
nr:MAG TPA: hypothetical protein [Caudoviricetes sp.]